MLSFKVKTNESCFLQVLHIVQTTSEQNENLYFHQFISNTKEEIKYIWPNLLHTHILYQSTPWCLCNLILLPLHSTGQNAAPLHAQGGASSAAAPLWLGWSLAWLQCHCSRVQCVSCPNSHFRTLAGSQSYDPQPVEHLLPLCVLPQEIIFPLGVLQFFSQRELSPVMWYLLYVTLSSEEILHHNLRLARMMYC